MGGSGDFCEFCYSFEYLKNGKTGIFYDSAHLVEFGGYGEYYKAGESEVSRSSARKNILFVFL